MQEDNLRKLKQEVDELKPNNHRAQPSGDAALKLQSGDDAQTFFVFADEQKNYSGLKLVKGTKYQFRFEQYSHQWYDAKIDAHPIRGWSNHANTFFLKTIQLTGRLFSSRRQDDLMVLQGAIEGTSNDGRKQFSFATDTDHVQELPNEEAIIGEFTSPGSGELYAFANDTKLNCFYRNNCGYLTVTLRAVT